MTEQRVASKSMASGTAGKRRAQRFWNVWEDKGERSALYKEAVLGVNLVRTFKSKV